jgi:hypothetical protein
MHGHKGEAFPKRLQYISKTGEDCRGQERKPEEIGNRFNVLLQISQSPKPCTIKMSRFIHT